MPPTHDWVCEPRADGSKQGDLQKEPPGGVFDECGDQGLGRSRGGFTTKLHLAVEQGQKPTSIVVTAGQSAAPFRTRPTRYTTAGSEGRYDIHRGIKLAVRYEVTGLVAAINEWL